VHRLRDHDRLGEPQGQFIGSFQRDVEILHRVDLIELIDRRHQQVGGNGRVLEDQRNIGGCMDPAPRADLAVLEREVAPGGIVQRLDLGGKILLPEPLGELWITTRLVAQRLQQAVQQYGEFQIVHGPHLSASIVLRAEMPLSVQAPARLFRRRQNTRYGAGF